MADLTRFEQFLNHIAHPEDPIPAPQTRMEQNLVEIAENKSGGGGGSDTIVLHFDEDGWADISLSAALAAFRAGKRLVIVEEYNGEIEQYTACSYLPQDEHFAYMNFYTVLDDTLGNLYLAATSLDCDIDTDKMLYP